MKPFLLYNSIVFEVRDVESEIVPMFKKDFLILIWSPWIGGLLTV